MNQADLFDAIIIGAGAAGLAAAKELREQGRSIVVIEARGRVGGRIFTYRDPALPIPIELGAEFLHGATPNTDTVIRAAGLTAVDVVGEHWQAREGRFRQSSFMSKIDKVLRKLDEHATPDRSFNDYLTERAERKRKQKDAAMRSLAMEFVQGFHAADSARVSERWLARTNNREIGPGNERMGRVLDGYDRIAASLARDIYDAIELNTVASTVSWQRGDAVVTCTDASNEVRTYHGRCVIVTVPVGVLQASPFEQAAISFSPEIPAVDEAISGLAMGTVLRTAFAFSERFWETELLRDSAGDDPGGLTSLGFLHSPGSQFPVWWTQFPVRVPLLVGWMGGPAATALCGLPEAEIERIALHSLAAHVGLPYERLAGLVRGSWMHNWERDPFSRGAYSYAVVGGSGAAYELARPVEETIFFAGEATATDGDAGTVEGALSTGLRAARGVLQSLGYESIPNE